MYLGERVAFIAAWTENGYDQVPVFDLYCDDPDDADYGRMIFICLCAYLMGTCPMLS